MMAVHELGHVLGALATGGRVTQVVLHPLSISRTDVLPNPNPGIVVWFGPALGCLLPLAIIQLVPKRHSVVRNITKFFAGFCLIANGLYIAIGSFGSIGDCQQMYRSGTPHWVMLAFGSVTIPLGLFLWHSLGSARNYWDSPTAVPPLIAWTVCLLACLSFAIPC